MGGGLGQGIRSNQLFNDEDYRQMVNDEHGESNESGRIDRPQSPYTIPEQVRLDKHNIVTPEQVMQGSDAKNQFSGRTNNPDTPAFQNEIKDPEPVGSYGQ